VKSPSPHYDRADVIAGPRVVPIRPGIHIGCSGDCADGADCTCSHSRPLAPRQPRRPEPRRPHLSLWTRLRLRFGDDWALKLALASVAFSAIALLGQLL